MVATATGLNHRLPVGSPSAAAVEALPGMAAAATPRLPRIAGLLEDGALALLTAYMLPLAILLVGTPIVLLARLAFEIVSRLRG